MMRLVTWNTRGFAAPEVVRSLHADVAILTETPERTVAAFAPNALWRGGPTASPRRKPTGVAVVGFGGWSVEPLPAVTDHPVFLPFRAVRGDEALQVVGCCVRKGHTGSVAKTGIAAIDDLAPSLDRERCIWAGDFNMHGVGGGLARSRPFFAHIRALGLRSVWHAERREELGRESRRTFRNHYGEFTIDYVLTPPGVTWTSVDIGQFAAYEKHSDHVPITVTLSPSGADRSQPPAPVDRFPG
ncbi:endonuclease/exonuclease/phosphatase family protein [Acuticoccus sediminis]|uniref:endonuclease/exonuclease/phosphatase family protein n=1 Tax=Acuticoccus sediminis TaxID=2184697 RepID=UPI001CFC79EC|nr:endonuclease/exonuclease/phosphatase family protein [Acuticoccus sediminis]